MNSSYGASIEMVLAQDENTRQQLLDQGQIDVLRNASAEYVNLKQKEVDAGEIQLISVVSFPVLEKDF